MLKSRKKKLIALITLAAVASAGLAFARHAHERMHDPEKVREFVSARVDDALDDIDATAEQRQRIHAVKERLLDQGKALHEGSRATHEEVLAEWQAETPDVEQLHKLVDERAAAFQKMGHEMVDAFVEAHHTLTPEQREIIAERIERFRPHH